MKKLLIFPLLVLLTGCVTYYQPETALEDGVYYAEDDPSYNVYQGYYPGYAYYPWSTLDYFYFGYHPYPIYAYHHGFPPYWHSYAPWHYPYGFYGYYPVAYVSRYHYARYPTWYPYSGYCMGYKRCDRGHREDDVNRDGRLAGRGGKGGKSRKKLAEAGIGDNNVLPDEFENPNATYMTGAVPFTRYVSTMPSGYSGNQGMVIRSGDSNKIGKSQIQPSKSASSSSGIIIVAEPSKSVTAPVSSGNTPTRSSSPPTSRSFSAPSSSRSVGSSSRSRPSASSSRSRTVRSTSPRPRRKQD